MIALVAMVAVILFVSQVQVDLLVDEPLRRPAKIVLLLVAIVFILFEKFA